MAPSSTKICLMTLAQVVCLPVLWLIIKIGKLFEGQSTPPETDPEIEITEILIEGPMREERGECIELQDLDFHNGDPVPGGPIPIERLTDLSATQV